ncbi:MAG: thioredoxin [Eubacteriales bacterium]
MEMKFKSANFEKEVLNSEIPVVVDFFADWCGPCRMMAPIIEKLAEDYEGKAKIGKLNIDENLELAQKYNVMSIPTIIIFNKGVEVETIVGMVSKNEIIDKIEKVLAI